MQPGSEQHRQQSWQCGAPSPPPPPPPRRFARASASAKMSFFPFSASSSALRAASCTDEAATRGILGGVLEGEGAPQPAVDLFAPATQAEPSPYLLP